MSTDTESGERSVASKTTKKLPTFRVGLSKQLDALRAYAVLSENGTKAVHYTKVAEIIKVHEANVSSMNPFFFESGFIERQQGGGFMPVSAIIDYNRAFSWNPETAGAKLAPVVSATWFGMAIVRRLQFRAMTEEEAVEVLASECMAGPDSRLQLRMLLDYCETAGIVLRENGQLRIPREPVQPSSAPIASSPAPPEPVAAAVGMAGSRPAFYGGGQASPAEGGINFQVSIHVDLAEMKAWPADRIAAFFAGMAQVLAAQENKGK
jgi:hypothetical protein